MSETITLSARWVFSGGGPPLERGLVTVAGGVVTDIQPSGPRAADHEFGNAAIIPGLVNAHTHLDLTGAINQIPPTSDFVDWLRRVIAYRRTRSAVLVAEDVEAGIAECLRSGTTLVADIAADGATCDALKRHPVRAVVFREMLGLTKERKRIANEGMKGWLTCFPHSLNCRPGASPHAPYSVRWSVYMTAFSCRVPVTIHLAESIAELELLANHTGPFLDFLKQLGVWDPEGLAKGPNHIFELTPADSHVLFVHCNYLAPDAPIPPNGTVVYCPRTHAAFGHPPHPFRDFLARGVRVALGTDSLASNPDLSILNEMRFVHARHPDVPGSTLLRMATFAGAEALGWADETGSLTPGKSADFAVVPLPDADATDPHLLLLESDCAVRETWFRGRRVTPN